MKTGHIGNSKLDEQLTLFMADTPFSGDARIPVFVTAVEGRLGAVESLAREIGQLRFVLQRINAVSAWVPMSAVARLAASPDVREIDLAEDGIPA